MIAHKIDFAGEPRSGTEMWSAAELQSCSGCGDRDHGNLELSVGRPMMFLSRTRPRTKLLYCFHTGMKNPLDVTPAAYHLGGDEPSQIIRPDQFVAEIERLAPLVVWEPETLGVSAWKGSGAAVGQIATCLNELLKFVVGAEIPATALDGAWGADRAERPGHRPLHPGTALRAAADPL